MKMTRIVSKLWRIPTLAVKTLILANAIVRINPDKKNLTKFGRIAHALTLFLTQFSVLSRFVRSSHSGTSSIPDNNENLLPCLVLGNGPSLSDDIDFILPVSRHLDIVCVNDFAITSLYAAIQPRYYVFADPCWWLAESPAGIVARREKVFSAIVNKTTWNLRIFVPSEAYKYFQSVFLNSRNVSVVHFNTDACGSNCSFAHSIYDIGLAMPICQNVLVAALYITLRLNYKEIILIGADHSWHQSLVLDGNNLVCMNNRHFYDGETAPSPWSKDGSVENIWSMSELFHALAKMFEGYEELEKYALYRSSKIYNASSITFIDAFQRKNILSLIEDIRASIGGRSSEIGK